MSRDDDDAIARDAAAQSMAHPAARGALEVMKRQLLIVLVARLGGEIEIPVSEIDATDDRNLALSVDAEARSFTFKVVSK